MKGRRVFRELVFRAARGMWEMGLVVGSSGNVSLRAGDVIYITPSGIPYRYLRPELIVELDTNGNPLRGISEPSSEWRMHLLIYREIPEVKAVVHTHSPYATAAAVKGRLECLHDEAALLFGREVPVARHAPPGTWELARAAVEALKGERHVCLLSCHGAVATGSTLTEALHRAAALEEAARIYFLGS